MGTVPPHAAGTLLTARFWPAASTVSWFVALLYDTATEPGPDAPDSVNVQPGRLVTVIWQLMFDSVPGVTPPDVAAVVVRMPVLAQLTVKGRKPLSTHVLNRRVTLLLIVLLALEATVPTMEPEQSVDTVLEGPWIVVIACVVAVAVNAVGDGLTTTDASAADAMVRDPIAIAAMTASILNLANILSSPGVGVPRETVVR
jgi:hypothetical protein